MIGTIYSGMMFVSEFTLALMEDSGWYIVDYNYSEPLFWGNGEGCQWFEKDCIDTTTGTSNWQQYFCDASGDDGCSADYTTVAYCLMYDWGDTQIPEAFQYYVCLSISLFHRFV